MCVWIFTSWSDSHGYLNIPTALTASELSSSGKPEERDDTARLRYLWWRSLECPKWCHVTLFCGGLVYTAAVLRKHIHIELRTPTCRLYTHTYISQLMDETHVVRHLMQGAYVQEQTGHMQTCRTQQTQPCRAGREPEWERCWREERCIRVLSETFRELCEPSPTVRLTKEFWWIAWVVTETLFLV